MGCKERDFREDCLSRTRRENPDCVLKKCLQLHYLKISTSKLSKAEEGRLVVQRSQHLSCSVSGGNQRRFSVLPCFASLK